MDLPGTTLTRFADFVVTFSLLWMATAPSCLLQAQVVEVSGGTSSLYQAGGGSVTMHGSGYDMTLGAGTVDGRVIEGARVLKATRQGTYIFGDDRIDFQLPTDIFDSSHYLLARGAGFSGIRHGFDAEAFAGLMSTEYNSPFFNGATIGDAAGLLFLKRKIGQRFLLYSDSVISKRSTTQIESLEWSPVKKVDLAGSIGVGANHPYGAVSVTVFRPRFDLQAAYIEAGERFHRIAATTLVLAEPNRENISLAVRPLGSLTLTGSHQNYLVPLIGAVAVRNAVQATNLLNAHSSIDQGSVSLHLLGTQWNGTVYHSIYDQPGSATAGGGIISSGGSGSASSLAEIVNSNHAAAFSANRDLTSRVHFNASYLVSKPKGAQSTDSLISTLSEALTSRLSVSEILSYSNGHTSVNFGGQFISNTLSVSATYDTYYVPAQVKQPFEQALLVDVKFKVLGRLLLHGASFVDPTGRVRYTADANTVFSHDPAPRPIEHVSLGRYVLHGCVLDSEGNAVEGAAVMIDEAPLYTDSNGCFQMRENSPRTHQMRVVMSEFLVGGNWQVVTMPTTVTSTTEDLSREMRVIVVIRRVRELSELLFDTMECQEKEGLG